MLDIFGFTNSEFADTQNFTINANVSAQHQQWLKPRGKNFLSITCIGGGSGGGGGAGAAIGSAKGGGGGGGSSGVAHYLYHMFFVPDILYVSIGAGGAGGAGGTSGSGVNGSLSGLSYVSVSPYSVAANILFAVSGTTSGNGGGGGTTAAGGGAGTAAGITGDTNAVFSRQALSRFYIAGVNGSTGGAQTGAVGSALAPGTACMFLGGTGGGGSTSADFAGGQFNSLATTPFGIFPGGLAGSDGNSGFRWGSHPIFYGGAGGGSSNSITGGRGGNGIVPGVGGGGGGAGTTNGGRGGDGGHGLVIMTSF